MAPAEPDPRSVIYEGKPLDASRRQIRLLTLQAGQWHSPICCDLAPQSLDSNPDYQALSYAWGSTDKNTKDITINGRPFPVLPNLHSILKRLRRNIKGENLVLWIDAICINQTGSEAGSLEKSSQIQMMATIYLHCREALIWMG
ncbi:hypothetical protein DL98DRAFT_443881, partial [Cadophora sp. DSE1049]